MNDVRRRPRIRGSWWNPKLSIYSFSVVLLALHLVLKQILARFDVISSVFAAGEHVPRWMISTAAAFAVVRLAAFILVPAALAWKITATVLARDHQKTNV